MLKILKFVKPYWGYVLAAFGCTIVAALSVLFVPGLIQNLTRNLQHQHFKYINRFITLGIAILIVRAIAVYWQNYLTSKAFLRALFDMRNQLFSHILRMPFSFHSKWRTGEIISRIVNDVDVIENTLINNSLNVLLNVIVSVGFFVKMFDLNWRLACIVTVIVPIIGLALSRFGMITKRITSLIQAKIADISSLIQETISGIRTVKSFSREKYESERFKNEIERNYSVGIKRAGIQSIQEPVIEMLTVSAIFFVIWFAVNLISKNKLSVDQLMAFIAVIFLIRDPVVGLSRVYNSWQQAIAASKRVFELFEISSEESEDFNGKLKMPKIEGHIIFKNANFSYEKGRATLKNINLDIKPGEMIAIVGPVGSGKTTLTNLIARFYDPAPGGEVLIDGYNLREMDIFSLRDQIGIVPQEVILFNATVKQNIAYGKIEATEKEILNVAKQAKILDFIEKLGCGFNSNIGEKGLKLSGGQRQCIAIARVLLKNPRIVLLDEATSSMDSESESFLQEALDNLVKGRTTIVIAHRLSTVRHADRIIVMNEGQIVEMGKHQELMRKKGLYHKLYKTQFSMVDQSSYEDMINV